MRTLSPQLAAHLLNGHTTLTRLWRIQRVDGQIIRLCDVNKGVLFSGELYLPDSGFSASAVEFSLNGDVSNATFSIAFTDSVISRDDLRRGLYDNAKVELFWVNYEDTTQGGIIALRGAVGQTDYTNELVGSIELNGLWRQGAQDIGQVYTPHCRADFCDAKCKLKATDHTYNAAVAAVTSKYAFTATALVNSAAQFKLGLVTFLTGRNAGLSYEVRDFDPATGTLTLFLSPAFPVAAADTFKVLAGCMKTPDMCRATYSNMINFRGEPFVPTATFSG